nr:MULTISPECIES: hypothetical protein [Streptomyces]
MYLTPGAGAVKSRWNRSGTGVADGSGIVVRTRLRRRMPAMENLRITRATRFSLILRPSARSSTVMRGEP